MSMCAFTVDVANNKNHVLTELAQRKQHTQHNTCTATQNNKDKKNHNDLHVEKSRSGLENLKEAIMA